MKSAILASCEALFPPGQVAELRVLGAHGSGSFTFNAVGWFDDMHRLADAAVHFHKKNPSGIYVTINAVHPACLARTNNMMEDRRKDSTADRDIIRRHWLPIDLDPQRPADVSATDDELKHASYVADAAAVHLERDFQFPPGLRALSGNGAHLLYRIDLPNDDVSREMVKDCLAGLAARLDSDVVHVDTGLFNAARILKLWGTAARKGAHMPPDRPHRLSKLWTPRAFADVEIVTETQLQALAATAPKTRKAKPRKARAGTGSKRGGSGQASKAGSETFQFDLDAWIERHGIRVTREESFDGTGTRYILEHCLFDDSHVRTSAAIGRTPSGAIFYRCQHQSCSERTWADAKALFGKSGPKVPGKAPAGSGAGSGTAPSEIEDENSPWDLAIALIDELFTDSDLGQVTLRRHRQIFYRYDQGRHAYVELSDDAMKVLVTRWLGEAGLKSTARAALDVMNALASAITGPDELEMPFRCPHIAETHCVQGDPKKYNWLALKNGILDIDRVVAGDRLGDCLMSHSTDWLSQTALDFDFPMTKDAGIHANWLAFLEEIFQGDQERVSVLQELFGYCFFRDTRLEKFFILQGNGSNGKSTTLAILKMLLGEENIATLSIDQLSDSRLRYFLHGATANICSDLPEMDRVEEGLLKCITSGESIVCDRKYKDGVRFTPWCKLIFSTNPLPRFADTTLAIWRRLLLIPFEYTVTPDKVDVNLKKKLAKELPGILLWALQGAARLHKTDRFTSSVKCQRANNSHRATCFPIYAFLSECTEQTGTVKTCDLWVTYKRWCKAFGLTKPKPLHAFVRDVIGFVPNLQFPCVKTGMAGEIELAGLSLRPNVDLEITVTNAASGEYPGPPAW